MSTVEDRRFAPRLDGAIALLTSRGMALFGMYGHDCPTAVENLTRLVGLGFYHGARVRRVVRENFAEIEPDVSVLGAWTARGLVLGEASHRISFATERGALQRGSPAGGQRPRPPPRRVRVDRAGLLLLTADDASGEVGSCRMLVTLSDRPLPHLEKTHLVVGELLETDARAPWSNEAAGLISSYSPSVVQRDAPSVEASAKNIFSQGRASGSAAVAHQASSWLRALNVVALTSSTGRSGNTASFDGAPIKVIRVRRGYVVSEATGPTTAAADAQAVQIFRQRCAAFDMASWLKQRIGSSPATMSGESAAGAPTRPWLIGGNNDDVPTDLGCLGKADDGGTAAATTRRSSSPQYNAAELYGGFSSEDEWCGESAAGSGRRELDANEVEAQLKRAASTRALMLQLMGDMPAAAGSEEGLSGGDAEPPDNVLFVCRLNPFTQDGDLAMCFRQFGTIISCEIIRDRKTGRSLNYAFIEFATKEQCDRAYRKMDRVLIDDSRIHVDFCQSVSAALWRQRRGSRVSHLPPTAKRARDDAPPPV